MSLTDQHFSKSLHVISYQSCLSRLLKENIKQKSELIYASILAM